MKSIKAMLAVVSLLSVTDRSMRRELATEMRSIRASLSTRPVV